MGLDDLGDDNVEPPSLQVKKHVAFWLRHLRMLPSAYGREDVQRMTLAYFCLGALDLLGAIDDHIPERKEYIDWIYSQQLPMEQGGGFCSSPYLPKSTASANLAMTYTALINLAILRDDFSRLDKRAVIAHVKGLQLEDGSFAGHRDEAGSDCRFVYCAFAICAMLQDWTGIDVDAAVHFLFNSRHYDGGFGQGPLQESQGGTTYCAIAALALCGRLDDISAFAQLQDWLIHRQQDYQGGFNGRTEKDEDVCYSFWCGATAQITNLHSMISIAEDIEWLLSCQTPMGGISKVPDEIPDVMHSYLALAALSMHGQEGHGDLANQIKPIDPRINITLNSLEWLRKHL